jgi:transposase-like protein
MGELCGFDVPSIQVSKLTAELDGEFEKWRNRPLPEISHLFADATYYKVRIDSNVRDCATPNSSPWQRCQFHLQQNAQAHVPTRDLKQKIGAEIHRIFNAEDRTHAEA